MTATGEGRLIAGRYRLESVIGQGGLATVWRAVDTTLDRPVAVKVLHRSDERDHARRISRFEREARIAGTVRHPNVVQILDFGTTEQETPYMVMEMLQGESLAVRLRREARPSLPEVIRIAESTLSGLDAVHTAGIVHRDIKPENVFLHREGDEVVPKILDFGISRLVEADGKRVSALTTSDGLIVGTPEYMSPEQARASSSEIDLRTDIYSMGVLIYEMLLGHVPFQSENVGDLLIAIVAGNATSLHAQRRDVPRAIADVVHKAMAGTPNARFAGALEMRQALLAANDTASLRSSRASSLAPRVEAHTGSTSARRGRSWSLAAAVTVAFGLVLWWAHDGATSDVSASADGAQLEPAAQPVSPAPVLVTAAPLAAIVTVELRGVPHGARVTVDGEVAAGARLRLSRDGRHRMIEVSASGKAPWHVAHRATADAVYEVELLPAQPAQSQAVRSRPRAGAKPRANFEPPRVFGRIDF